MKPAVAFDRDSARRIVKATRAAERAPTTVVAASSVPRALVPAMYGRTTAAIKAGSAAGPGRGKGKLLPISYDEEDEASYGPPSDEFPFYSFSSDPVAAGTLVVVAMISGRYHVICELCSAGSSPAPAASTSSAPGYMPDGFAGDGFTPDGF